MKKDTSFFVAVLSLYLYRCLYVLLEGLFEYVFTAIIFRALTLNFQPYRVLTHSNTKQVISTRVPCKAENLWQKVFGKGVRG